MVDPGLALTVFAGVALIVPLLLWPRSGLVPRLVRLSRLDERVRLEDALKHVYKCQLTGASPSLESVAGQLEVSTARAATLVSRLSEMGLVRLGDRGPSLTLAGERTAVRVVRTHRLWERYLADRTGVPAVEWHDEAEQMEHALSDAEVEALDARLGRPPWDPHGDPIPTAGGVLPPQHGTGLMSASPGRIVEVVHLEDEPREIYDALTGDGLGLVLGARLQVLDRTDRGVHIEFRGRSWIVDSVKASNVTVRELPEGARPDETPTTLLEAAPGETVRVCAIAQACQGTQRRRLLDLGVVRGAAVTSELVSASGDPVAYRIRGALIALRRSQAAHVLVETASGDHAGPGQDHDDGQHGIEEVA
jgi:DtxR family Mn-dependent transcriptional regulator